MKIGPLEIQPVRLHKRSQLDELLAGDFEELLGSWWVINPSVIEDLVDRFEVATIIASEVVDLSKITPKTEADILKLKDFHDEGRLRILTPTREGIHSKLYILISHARKRIRVVDGSVNPTEFKRWNHATVIEGPSDHPLLQEYLRHFQMDMEICQEYLGDLFELFKSDPSANLSEIVVRWVEGKEPEREANRTIEVVEHRVLRGEDEYVTVELPKNAEARRIVQRELGDAAVFEEDRVQVHRITYLVQRQQLHKLPTLITDLERGEVRLLDPASGDVQVLNQVPPNPEAVRAALEQVERIVDLAVQYGSVTNERRARLVRYEAILYVLFSPFLSEWTRRRQTALRTGKAGPRHLYVTATSTNNGKTTLLEYALGLILGTRYKALEQSLFKPDRVKALSKSRTTCPAIFKDIQSGQHQAFQATKEHWDDREVGKDKPAIIIESNTQFSKPRYDSVVARCKVLSFDDITLPASRGDPQAAEAEVEINDVLRSSNPIFQWFSHVVIGEFQNAKPLSRDELELARNAMVRLYDYAGWRVPAWFPSSPAEEIAPPVVDLLREYLRPRRQGLRRVQKIWKRDIDGKAHLNFGKNPDHTEIWRLSDGLRRASLGSFHVQKSKDEIIVRPADEFNRWMEQMGLGGSV